MLSARRLVAIALASLHLSLVFQFRRPNVSGFLGSGSCAGTHVFLGTAGRSGGIVWRLSSFGAARCANQEAIAMTPFDPLEIRHLDLSQGLPARLERTERRGLYLVLWWADLPLGHCQIPGDQLPASASALTSMAAQTISPAVIAYWAAQTARASIEVTPDDTSACAVNRRATRKRRAQIDEWPPRAERAADLVQLLALERPLSKLDDQTGCESVCRVSVVVCTRDRPESLLDCLQSLTACVPPPAEIIVVDNASRNSSTRDTVALFPQARYVVESRPGLDIARNTGVQHITGEIVAFTDDDVRVHPNWIAALSRSFADPIVMGITGLVLPDSLGTPAQALFEQHWGFNRGYQVITYDGEYFGRFKRVGVPIWNIGAGANMAFRRTVFEQIGGFDERLDVGAAGCSGDSEYWYRMLAADLPCRYDPQVVVLHRHRESMADLKHQMYSYMRGHTTALLVQFERHRHWGNLLRLFVLLPIYFVKQFVRRLVLGPHSRFTTIASEILGCFAGLGFYLRSITIGRWKWRVPRNMKSHLISTDEGV
jgi:GT2 family glycosyltransferase